MDIEYNQSRVHDLLNKLEISQESITNASRLYLSLGKSQGTEIMKILVTDWNIIFMKFLNLEKMNLKILAMMYLLNDIIQNSRSKHNVPCSVFVSLFQEVLSKHLKNLILQADHALKKELYKVLSIWKERKVYPVDWLSEYFALYKNPDDKNDMIPENLVAIPSDLILYVQSYQDFIRWREKTDESNNSLKALDNLIVPENFDYVKADCDLANFKRCLDIQNRYRTSYLKNAGEMLKNVERNHAKMVFNLKNVCKTLNEMESLEEELND